MTIIHPYEPTAELPPSLSEESRQCIRNLVNYRAPPSRMTFPRSRCAAVLIALFAGRKGDLYILLSQRSPALRTYAGDTTLPGGRVDANDKTIEDTARREAFEEIGLPPDKTRVPLLCIMEPLLAANQLVVTPVVVFISDRSIRPKLNPLEVASIFAHPLSALLRPDAPFPIRPPYAAADYHTYNDMPWSEIGPVRMHSFLTGREGEGIKPIYGLTAAILIRTASLAYARPPNFPEYTPSTPTMQERLAHSLLTHPQFHRALTEEGRTPDDPAVVHPELVARVKGWVEHERARKERTRREKEGKAGPDEQAQGNAEMEVYEHMRKRRARSRL